jgi:cysteine desulfurase/selenocysteine lyase
MTTPEDRGPAELRLVSHGPADLAGAPSSHVPTPGVSSGVARVPTSPTLPDPEPTSLSLLVQRLANELFTAPPAAAPEEPAVPSQSGVPSQSSVPSHASIPSRSSVPAQSSVPSHAAVPASPAGSELPREVSNPFAVAPSFDALPRYDVGGSTPDAFEIPLFEAPTMPHEAPRAATPAGAPQAPGREALPPRETVAIENAPGFQLDPHVGLELPKHGAGFDAHALKREFPILAERVHGKPLVWLDNAATTQKPRAVIDRLVRFYEHENSNIHRAAHALAARATDAYEAARESVRRFLNAPSTENVVFARGATEGINLVAQAWGRSNVREGDEIVVSHLEHHANIVPWQQLCKETGARLRVIPVDDRGQLLLDAYERLLSPRTRLVAVTQVSNALGTVTPAKAIVDMAHRHGARVLLDGAQSVSHLRVDVQALDCDFFVFSGHKVFAPTGIGAVVAKREVLEAMPPWQGGGNMIADVTFERTLFQPPPARFEAGTGNIADAVGLGAALDWLTHVGLENVARHEHALLEHGTARLSAIEGLTIVGTAAEKAGVLSFVIRGHETRALSEYLDREGIAVRGGHHCAQPICC